MAAGPARQVRACAPDCLEDDLDGVGIATPITRSLPHSEISGTGSAAACGTQLPRSAFRSPARGPADAAPQLGAPGTATAPRTKPQDADGFRIRPPRSRELAGTSRSRRCIGAANHRPERAHRAPLRRSARRRIRLSADDTGAHSIATGQTARRYRWARRRRAWSAYTRLGDRHERAPNVPAWRSALMATTARSCRLRGRSSRRS
jgi:hypothetical protein